MHGPGGVTAGNALHWAIACVLQQSGCSWWLPTRAPFHMHCTVLKYCLSMRLSHLLDSTIGEGCGRDGMRGSWASFVGAQKHPA